MAPHAQGLIERIAHACLDDLNHGRWPEGAEPVLSVVARHVNEALAPVIASLDQCLPLLHTARTAPQDTTDGINARYAALARVTHTIEDVLQSLAPRAAVTLTAHDRMGATTVGVHGQGCPAHEGGRCICRKE